MQTIVLALALLGATWHIEPPRYEVSRAADGPWDQCWWEVIGEPVLVLEYDGFPYDACLRHSKLHFWPRGACERETIWMDDRPVLIRLIRDPLRRR